MTGRTDDTGGARLPLGARVGTVLGFLGWLLGLAMVSFKAGDPAVLARVALPGIALSLGIAAIVIVSTETAARMLSPGRPVLLLVVGEVLFFVGLLILLLNHWVAPLIDAAEDLHSAIDRLGGIYRTGDALPTALMAAGAGLVGLFLRRLPRRA